MQLIHYDDSKELEAQALYDMARLTGWDKVVIIHEEEDDYADTR